VLGCYELGYAECAIIKDKRLKNKQIMTYEELTNIIIESISKNFIKYALTERTMMYINAYIKSNIISKYICEGLIPDNVNVIMVRDAFKINNLILKPNNDFTESAENNRNVDFFKINH